MRPIPSKEESLASSDFRVISRLSPPRKIRIDCMGHGGPCFPQPATLRHSTAQMPACKPSFAALLPLLFSNSVLTAVNNLETHLRLNGRMIPP
jgi:hypothetical protein